MQPMLLALKPHVDALQEALEEEGQDRALTAKVQPLLKGLERLRGEQEPLSCLICMEDIVESEGQPANGGVSSCCGQGLCFRCCVEYEQVNESAQRETVCPSCRRCVRSAEFQLVDAAGAQSSANAEQKRERLRRKDAVQTFVDTMPTWRSEESCEVEGEDAFFKACSLLGRAKLNVFEALSLAARVACSARPGVPPRVLVFYQFQRCAEDSVFAAKKRIQECIPSAEVYSLEPMPESSDTARRDMPMLGQSRFKDDRVQKEVFLLINTSKGSTSIAGADLGNATAAVVVGEMTADYETQLIGRFMRMSTKGAQPYTKVIHLYQQATED